VKAQPNGVVWPTQLSLLPEFEREGVCTLPDVLRYGQRCYGDRQFMGTRAITARSFEDRNGKKFEKLSLGDYTWKSYEDVQKEAEAVGCFLRKMDLKQGDRIAIFAETRAEWFITAMGALQQRICVCTIYTTLPDAGIVHAINETEVTTVVSSYDLLQRLGEVVKSCPNVKSVIVFEDQLNGVGETNKFPTDVQVIPYSDASKPENIDENLKTNTPEPEDIAIIMYTSGSTGVPKGVEMTHNNIMTSVIAYSCQVNVGKDDRYLAFLPLAHIMELATEIALIPLGIRIFYSTPHTMTTSSTKVGKGSIGDAKLAKPTMMNAVPLLPDRIIKGVWSAVEKQGFIKKAIFHTMVYFKSWIDYIPSLSAFVDRVVFRKVREELGGDLKRVVAGGAPLSPQSHGVFRSIFGVSLQIGYASTETSSCTSGTHEYDPRIGHCGHPCLGVQVRLEDWEEGNYKTSDRPHPRGEIVVGGPSVAKGYFKMPEETTKCFYVKDGVQWFRTGDIGEIDDDGCIKIIDRKKDLVKLKHGEYISLGHTESLLKTHSLVDNICIFADSCRDKIVAVVSPDLSSLREIAFRAGLASADASAATLCNIESVTNLVLKELQSHGKRCGLSRWEIPSSISLDRELWTPDTGLVTAAFKLRRAQLTAQFRACVQDMYSKLED